MHKEYYQDKLELLLGRHVEVCSVDCLRFQVAATSRVHVCTVHFRMSNDERQSINIVRKTIPKRWPNEPKVYEELLPEVLISIPRLYWVDHQVGTSALYLEYVQPVEEWPWQDISFHKLVLGQLARLHAHFWNQNDRLASVHWLSENSSAYYSRLFKTKTYQTISNLYKGQEHGVLGDLTSDLIASVENISRALQRILHFLHHQKRTLLHGDLHGENVLVGKDRHVNDGQVLIIDWDRARLGHPLEDLSRWIENFQWTAPEITPSRETLLHIYSEALEVALGGEWLPQRDFLSAYYSSAVIYTILSELPWTVRTLVSGGKRLLQQPFDVKQALETQLELVRVFEREHLTAIIG